MTHGRTDRSRHRQDVALFRYRVIAPLLSLEPGSSDFGRTLKAQAARRWVIPGSSRRRVAVSTVREWLRTHRDHGFDGLLPKPRKDASKPRRMDVETIEALLGIKRDNPGLSVRKAIQKARDDGVAADGVPLPPTTVHRLFSREGLMDMTASPPVERRRFSHERAGDLWMSDVLHGPRVRDGRTGRKRKTCLVSFIDDCTRVVPYSAFRFSETTQDFLQVLRQAVMRRGRPVRLYVDNGASYRSRQTALVCARLDIALIHARPRSPAGKGKIERYFRTLRGQFLSNVDADGLRDLDALNRRLHAWVEGEYHRTPHRGIDGLTPLDRWARTADRVRYPDLHDGFDDLFLFEDERVVHRDCTVRLNNRIYEVDAALTGRKVTLRHDPAAPPGRPLKVTFDGRDAGLAHPVDAVANARRFDPGRGGVRFARPEDG